MTARFPNTKATLRMLAREAVMLLEDGKLRESVEVFREVIKRIEEREVRATLQRTSGTETCKCGAPLDRLGRCTEASNYCDQEETP